MIKTEIEKISFALWNVKDESNKLEDSGRNSMSYSKRNMGETIVGDHILKFLVLISQQTIHNKAGKVM